MIDNLVYSIIWFLCLAVGFMNYGLYTITKRIEKLEKKK